MATTTDARSGRPSQSAPSANTTPQNSPDYSPTAPEDDARTILINEIKWGAVFAGAALALSAQLIIDMIGLALGLASFSIGDGASAANPDAGTFSTTAAAWWAISGIVASFLGGVAAGRLSGSPKHTIRAGTA